MILFLFLTWVWGGFAEAKILFIGDSHATQTFGQTLDALLRNAYGDENIASYASCGTRAQSWINGRRTRCGYRDRLPHGVTHRARRHSTPRVEELLEALRPSITVVSLGGNHTGQRQELFVESVRELAQAIRNHGSQCLWVGPPPGRVRHRNRGLNRSEIQDLLPEALANLCMVLDSRHYVSYPRRGGDGIHFDSIRNGGRELARGWAEGVFNAALPFIESSLSGYANP